LVRKKCGVKTRKKSERQDEKGGGRALLPSWCEERAAPASTGEEGQVAGEAATVASPSARVHDRGISRVEMGLTFPVSDMADVYSNDNISRKERPVCCRHVCSDY
jgi:hypothetical protein